jgi:hypothetical protein
MATWPRRSDPGLLSTPQRRAPARPLPLVRRRPESVTVILREPEVEPGCDGP